MDSTIYKWLLGPTSEMQQSDQIRIADSRTLMNIDIIFKRQRTEIADEQLYEQFIGRRD